MTHRIIRNSDSRQVIVILGMHRSGTSLLSGVLDLLDLDLGQSIMPPSIDNSKGYFENSKISAANERLLKHLGINWAEAYRFPFNEIKPENAPKDYLEELKKLLTIEYTSGKHLLIKDPRMCILLPLWKTVFAELNLHPKYLIIIRNPGEVQESLRKRDFLSYSGSEKLWLYYNLCAELYTRGENRLFITYDDLLDSPVQTVHRIREFFPFLSDDTRMGEKINQFVEPGLRHHHSSGKSSFISEETWRLYQLFKEASISGLSVQLEKDADNIRADLEEKNIFKIPHSEDHEYQVKLLYSDGTTDIHNQLISPGAFHMDLDTDPSKDCQKVFFHPCNDHCAIIINSIRLFDDKDQFFAPEMLFSNETHSLKGLHIFAHQIPLVYFLIPAGLKLKKIKIEAAYEAIGEDTSQILNKPSLHILYILSSFPTVTEMSTLNEITGMIRRGVEVSIVSLRKPGDLKQVHDDIERYQLADRTFYLNVSTGIKKWKNILIRTVYGQVKLFLKTNITLNNKIKVSVYSLKKKSRRISLVHLADLINQIVEKKPDVIYFHFATHAGELIILRRIFKIPYVVFFHGYDFSKKLPFDELNYAEMFRYGDWFFTNSSFAGMKVEGLGCPRTKLSVTGLPVDDHQYPYSVRSRKEKIRILTVGRLVEKKGLEYSIEAVARLLKDYPDLEYNIIGDGPLETSLMALIKSYGAVGKINLLGSRKKAEVIEMMLGSEIFLLSSVTAADGETEGLPMVSLESQLTGMPIIATLHSGFKDSILDGVSGFLVPERDVEALHERLSWLIGHPETWEAMGKAGRQHVLDNFSERVYLDKILSQIYEIRENF